MMPEHGYVPDSDTAVRIAEAVWVPIYGERQVESRRPFEATLSDGVWTVAGVLPKGHRGGTMEAKIARGDGRILEVGHGR